MATGTGKTYMLNECDRLFYGMPRMKLQKSLIYMQSALQAMIM